MVNWEYIFAGLTLLISVVAIVASIYSIYVNFKTDIKLSQYNSMSFSQDEAITNLYGLEDYLDSLMYKYKISAGDEESLKNKINENERGKINEYITKINILLAKMYIISSEKNYPIIKESIPLEKMKLTDIKWNMLIAMRKMQYPNTQFDKPENISFFYKL